LRDLWNWSSFFDLCRHEDALVRWRAVEVCSILLGVDERGRRALLGDGMVVGGDGVVVEAGGLGQSVAVVGRRGASETDLIAAPSCSSLDPTAVGVVVAVPYHHHPAVVDIGGILHPKISAPNPSSSTSGNSSSSGSRSSRLVPTASASRNLANLSLAMTVDRPILLHGPAGAGKSLLAREVARLAGEGNTTSNNNGGSLHLDDQTDSKSLLGSHACTDVPGEFAWQPGALTRAAMAGTWVLFEDLDRAAFEVLAAIGPLLEGRPLALPGRRKPLRAAPGFRVFGTVTTSGPGRVVLGGAADFGALWTHVAVEPLSIPETLEVARQRYPGLPSPALKRLLHTMVVARGPTAGGHRGGFGFASRSSAGREPGVRDFLKLCSRV
ncbi:unnamed protein product, partial [Laminaria digitata]